MRLCLHIFLLGIFCVNTLLAVEPALVVYETVPGEQVSEHYKLAVKGEAEEDNWKTAFAFITKCKSKTDEDTRYAEHLNGWSNTYINFEMSRPVVVAIGRVDGQPIRSAMAHPRRHVKSCEVRSGKVFVTIEKPCLIAVDIDGQMDGQDTGKGYKGQPIHTVTIFANPLVTNRPRTDDPSVLVVSPGSKPPSDGDWKTLYFLPGVHDIGIGFPVHANRNYYIPGDAIVYGTLLNHDWSDGHDIRIFGCGTLSGERIDHPLYAKPRPKQDSDHNPIHIVGAANTTVEGITIADSAHHSLMLISPFEEQKPTVIRWVKIFTWRVNGDGINPFSNGMIEDCFIRTQDDSLYVNGRGIRRVTTWNDMNGSSFVLSALPNRPLIVEDCDVIYSRAAWHQWSGGRVFNMRGEGEGDCGAGVVFRNIRVEDSRPTLQPFLIAMQGVVPYGKPEDRRGAGNMSGVLFENIEIAASSVLGERDILWGAQDARIVNITFENLLIGDQKISSLDHFMTNEYVEGIQFR